MCWLRYGAHRARTVAYTRSRLDHLASLRTRTTLAMMTAVGATSTFEPHRLHGVDRTWTETNCYIPDQPADKSKHLRARRRHQECGSIQQGVGRSARTTSALQA